MNPLRSEATPSLPVAFVTVDTVTVLVATLAPSSVVAEIIAVPTPTGVTTPFTTVAPAALLVAQVTVWFVAVAGNTVATSGPVGTTGCQR